MSRELLSTASGFASHTHGDDADTYRFCPRCGGAFDRRRLKPDEPMRLVCTSCEFVFYLDPKVAVGTIIRIATDPISQPGATEAVAILGSTGFTGTSAPAADSPALSAPMPAPDSSTLTAPLAHRSANGRIVLVRRAIDPGYGKWVFPGGYVDRGEALVAAAVREAREECGLDVRLDGLVNVYSYPGRAPVIVVYAATAVGGALAAADECLESAEFDAESIPWSDLAFRSTRDALRDYLAGLLHPVRS